MTVTVLGQTHIKRYQAGFVPAIAESIAFGVGGRAENANDTALQFEVERSEITLVSYDFVNNKLIFKAPIPEDYAGSIYEVALYSQNVNAAAGEFGSRLLSTFDSGNEEWVDASTGTAGTFNSANTRIGADSLRHTPALSTTKTDSLGNTNLDLSGYSAADKFILSYNVGNGNTSAVRMLFLTNSTNYYTVNFGTPTSGYKTTEVTKGSATATGTPSWANITELRVQTVSTAGGASQVDYDGLRIEDTDTLNTDYLMVARDSLSSPYVKQEGMSQEVEFSLNISVS